MHLIIELAATAPNGDIDPMGAALGFIIIVVVLAVLTNLPSR
jgi:hypothetical protein